MSLISRILAPPVCRNNAELSKAVRGKVILVTGASHGIGEALALRLGRVGATVLLAARSEDRLSEVRDTVQESGGEADVFPLDLRDPEQVDSMARELLDRYPRIDVVVHNAGKSIRRSLHRSLDRPHDFERCMGVNYLGPMRLQLALLPSMFEGRHGHIINVSSVSVRLAPAAHWAAYHCSKTAFDLWLGAAVPELRPYGIACTSIYFGLVHTRMSAPTEAYKSMPGQTPEEAAGVICRALVRKPRVLQPWWLGPAHWLSAPLEPVSEWIQSKIVSTP